MLGLLLVTIGLVAAIKPVWFGGLANRPSRETRLVGAGLIVLGLVRMGSGAGYLLFWAGFVAAVLGLVGLFRPLPRLRIASRKPAAAVLGTDLAVMVTGAVIAGPGTPPEPGPAEQTAAGTPSPAAPAQPAGDTASPLPTASPETTATAPIPSPTPSAEPSEGEAPKPSDPLIGVDTPEIYGEQEPYGPEASAFTQKQLTGKKAWLEKDVSGTNRYGRALRYVWLKQPSADPTALQVREGMFNAILVVQGYAQASTYPPDVRYADFFVKFQREARAAYRGLWRVSGSSGSSSGGTKSGSGSSAGSSGSGSGAAPAGGGDRPPFRRCRKGFQGSQGQSGEPGS